MDRPAQNQLTPRLARLRDDAAAIAEAAVAGVAADTLVPQAWRAVDSAWRNRATHVLAAGKAAPEMLRAFLRESTHAPAGVLAVGPRRPDDWPLGQPWITGGHPFPTESSHDAGLHALAFAESVLPDAGMILLLSGGASALMAAPVPGLSLASKQHTIRTAMTAGADITALNAIRKHLSAVKGGRLARACQGRLLTLAISDVVGDDLSVIGSGPGVPDPSTWAEARDALRRFGGATHDPAVLALVDRGCAGALAETPKAGDPSMARAEAHVIGGRRQAMAAAAAAGRRLGYEVVVDDEPVTGEARVAAGTWVAEHVRPLAASTRPVMIVSSGETTVRVTGTGRGGRNQEFALAAAAALAAFAGPAVLMSIGTDGIDGPTDAAGALADNTTLARARALGLPAPGEVLDRNDSHAFFDALSDLVKTGPTGTNVGDLQVLLTAPA